MSRVIEEVRFGYQTVKMLSEDNGITYHGDAGEPGLILVSKRDPTGRIWMSLEDRKGGNAVRSKTPKRLMNAAAAELRKEILRYARTVANKGIAKR